MAEVLTYMLVVCVAASVTCAAAIGATVAVAVTIEGRRDR